MGGFQNKAVTLGDDGATPIQPVPFSGRLTEQQFEDHVVSHPELLGEELLILGRQLADFVEDNKRLDVLAVDGDGELVLIELKVTEEFGFTDLQALGYAGAYAELPTEHYAETLRHSVGRNGGEQIRAGADLPADPTLEDARAAIAEFVGVAEFEDWKPSRQVRIKLVAPGFPKRVLTSVKWLGDVHGLSIEAIRAHLLEVGGHLQIHVERLLPLPGAEEFDLSTRSREESIKRENKGRRPRVYPLLVKNNVIKDGDTLLLTESALPPAFRDCYEEGHIAFTAHVRGDTPNMLAWQPDEGAEEELIWPTDMAYQVCVRRADDDVKQFLTGVAENFIHEPTGKTLGELAVEAGLWTEPG